MNGILNGANGSPQVAARWQTATGVNVGRRISIVIPALNEEAAIAQTILTIREALRQKDVEHEIIVVSDGSTDETARRARDAGAVVLEHPKPAGYGKSLKDGIIAARYDLIGITDADGTYPNHRLPELLDAVVTRGFDMAVGARTGREYRGTFLKMPARRVFLWLSEYATGNKIDDINSGLRVFRRDLPLRFIHTISNGFSFTTTITLAAMLNGYYVTYLPIEYHKRVGRSHVRYWRDSLRSFQIIVENILYYNTLKLFLLLCQMLLALAVVGTVILALVPTGRWGTFAAVLAAGGLVSAIVVAAIGLAAALSRTARYAGDSLELEDAQREIATRSRLRRGLLEVSPTAGED